MNLFVSSANGLAGLGDCLTSGCPTGSSCMDDGTGTENMTCYGLNNLPVSSGPLTLNTGGTNFVGCMAPGNSGPLAPNQVYCDTGTQTPGYADTSTGPGAGLTLNGQPTTTAPATSYTPYLIGAGVLLLGMMFLGGRK
jgi:hypothetical protein